MALAMSTMQGLFGHNQEFGEGVAERGNRAGQATIVVSIDGTGDAEALVEAHKMLPDGGGVIYVKEGTYVFDGALYITKDNVSIIGAGRSTRFVATTDVELIKVDGADNCVINGVYFIGTNAVGDTNQDGVWLFDASNCTVENCWFYQNSHAAVLISGTSSENIVRGNLMSSSHNYQVGLVGDNNIITQNIIKNGAKKGILSGLSRRNIISNNQVLNNGDEGIITVDGDENVITSNYCRGNDEGITIADVSSTKNLIVGNISLGNTTSNYTDNGTGTYAGGNIFA